MPTITIIVGSCAILTAAIVLWKHRTVAHYHTDATITGERLKTNLTRIRWYSEMMLKQDFGKLNFAQMEYLHEANQACEQAIENMGRIAQDEDLEKTSKEWEGMMKKRKK